MPPNNKPIWTMNTRKKSVWNFSIISMQVCYVSVNVDAALLRMSEFDYDLPKDITYIVLFSESFLLLYSSFFLQQDSFMTDGPHFFLQTYWDGDRWVFNDSVLLWTNGKRENAHPNRASLPCKFSSKQWYMHILLNQNYQLDDRCGNGGRYSLHEHWACCCPMMILRR